MGAHAICRMIDFRNHILLSASDNSGGTRFKKHVSFFRQFG